MVRQASTEALSFLDEDVVQFCSDITPRYKLKGWTDKWATQDRSCAPVLPSAIAGRRKTMFALV